MAPALFDAGGRVTAGIETACVGKGTCGLCRVRVLPAPSSCRRSPTRRPAPRQRLSPDQGPPVVPHPRRPAGDVTVELAPQRKPKPVVRATFDDQR